jgi:hypothetical protein
MGKVVIRLTIPAGLGMALVMWIQIGASVAPSASIARLERMADRMEGVQHLSIAARQSLLRFVAENYDGCRVSTCEPALQARNAVAATRIRAGLAHGAPGTLQLTDEARLTTGKIDRDRP